jgi:hypothetical protein
MTSTPTNKDDLVSRVAKLEARLEEMGRKTLNYISVTDPLTGVQTLQIDEDANNQNRARVRIRDSSGNVLFQNDTKGQGWGYVHPSFPYVWYPFDSRTPLHNTTGTYLIYWNSAQYITQQRIAWAFALEISAGATGQFKFTYTDHLGALQTVFEVSLTTSNNNYNGFFTFPANEYSAGNNMSAWCRVTAGVDGTRFAAITPYYVLGVEAP